MVALNVTLQRYNIYPDLAFKDIRNNCLYSFPPLYLRQLVFTYSFAKGTSITLNTRWAKLSLGGNTLIFPAQGEFG